MSTWRVAIAMYRAARVVQVGFATSGMVVTNSGVAAGCKLATYLVRAFLVGTLDAYVGHFLVNSARFWYRLTVYIDDLFLQVIGRDPIATGCRLATCARDAPSASSTRVSLVAMHRASSPSHAISASSVACEICGLPR